MSPCAPFRFWCQSLLIALLLFLGGMALHAQDGFARKVTGGSGGKTITVRTPREFVRAVTGNSTDKRIIYVEGTIDIGHVPISSNRSIIGKGRKATLIGNLEIRKDTNNIILQNLHITNPMSTTVRGGGDGVTIYGAQMIWIDHCTFYDCADGCVDVVQGSDLVTISWCKFYFTNQPEHRFTMLAMGTEKDKKTKKQPGKLRITLHHNWWAENCESRMPAARNAKVHMYNNFFSCSGNSYCSNARPGTEMLSERNYYQKVKNPCYKEGGASLKTVNNIYDRCTGKAEIRHDSVFSPPYDYTLDAANTVPKIVRDGAGAR